METESSGRVPPESSRECHVPESVPGPQLAEALEPLLAAYRDVRLYIEQLPKLGVIVVRDRTRIPAATIGHQTEAAASIGLLGRPSKKRTQRRVSRWFTRLYVDSHIRKQLLDIAPILRIHALGTDHRAQQLTTVCRRLEEHAAMLRGWGGLRSVVANLPVISAALPAMSGVIWAAILGTGAWPDWRAARVVLLTLGAVALISLFVVWLPSIHLGFIVKRALLAGGSLPNDQLYLDDHGSFVWGTGHVFYAGFPGKNVYRLEDSAFAVLGVRKRREVPLDLILRTVAGGYLIGGLLLVNLGLFWRGLEWSWGLSLVSSVALALVISLVFLGLYYESVRASIAAVVAGPRAWRRRRDAQLC